MGLVLLIRHAVTDQTGKRLYGRTEGIGLSEEGRAQAGALAERLRPLPIRALYVSPLDRCRETAEAIAESTGVRPAVLNELNEVDYGRWTGRSFTALRRLKVWQRVRSAPAAIRFPGGETLAEVQHRAVGAIEGIAARHARATVALVTHGDVVRLALAHYAGVHIDLFQRLEVWPASVTAVVVGEEGPRIVRVNDTGSIADLLPRRPLGKVRG